LHAGIKLGKGDLAGQVLAPARPEAPREVDHVAPLDALVIGINNKTEPVKWVYGPGA
jgi:hypothetical protein